MTVKGEDKMMKPDKMTSMKRIKYIGHQEAVYTPPSANWRRTEFKRGEVVEVPPLLAEALLQQPDKFEEA